MPSKYYATSTCDRAAHSLQIRIYIQGVFAFGSSNLRGIYHCSLLLLNLPRGKA
jgi:hypothetical protein